MSDAEPLDQVLEEARGVQLTCRMIDGETVLIEGSAHSLTFLGRIILAQARAGRDCGFQLHPQGAGNAHFSAEATHGIYIHRTPCRHPDHGESAE